jgi:dolichol kinase
VESWSPTLPPFATTAWLFPALAVAILAVFAAAGGLKRRGGERAAYPRKLVHVAVFTLAALLATLFDYRAVNLLGGTAALVTGAALWRGRGSLFYAAIARSQDERCDIADVAVPFIATAAGGVLATALFARLAATGFLVAGWGDAAAELAGRRWGHREYPVWRHPALGRAAHRRSLEGSAAMLAASFIAAAAGLLFCLPPPVDSPGAILLASFAAAAAATVAEALSPRGLDNLTVQLAACLAARAALAGTLPVTP